MQNLNINPDYFVLPMFSLSQEVFISLGKKSYDPCISVFFVVVVSCNTFQFLLLCMIIHPGFLTFFNLLHSLKQSDFQLSRSL